MKMFSKLLKYITVVSILLFTAGRISAQNFNDALRLSEPGLGFSARALGMGNSYTALSDDYSAVFFNPAGLGLLKRMEFAGGLNFSKFNNNTSFFNTQTDYSNSSTKLDQLSFAFPFPTMRGSLVFAIGYSRNKDFNNSLSFAGLNSGNTSMIQDLTSAHSTVPFDLWLNYPVSETQDATLINGNLFQSGTTLASGNLGKWSFAGAIEVLKNVYIGGTFNVVTGSFKRTRDYSEEDLNGVYRNTELVPNEPKTQGLDIFSLTQNLDWDISGYDAKHGLLFKPNQITRVGVTVNFPTSFKIKETFTEDASSRFFSGSSFSIDPIESTIEYNITSPYILTAGASVNLRSLILSGEVSYIDYSQMEFDSEGDLTLQEVNNNNKDIVELLRGTANFNVGAEYRIPTTDLRIRGGFMLKPSPFKGDPGDFDKKYITFGLGYLMDESLSLDLGYAYGWWKDISENYGYNESRTNQDIKYHNVLMTLSYRF
jgi:long-subunit fatty acid transport protein